VLEAKKGRHQSFKGVKEQPMSISGAITRLIRRIRYPFTSIGIVPDEFLIGFYESQVHIEFPDRQSAWMHYVKVGSSLNHSPSTSFNPAYYLEKYPDVRKAYIEPFSHYLRNGKTEGRSPLPMTVLQLSDTIEDGALEINLEVNESERYNDSLLKGQGVASIDEYLQRDGANGDDYSMLRPVPWFEPSQYYALNPDVLEARIDAYSHFLATGRDEGRAFSVPNLRSVEHVMSLVSLASKKEEWQSSSMQVPMFVDYVEAILKRIKKKIANHSIRVFVCSDDPMVNIGGVQRVVKEKVSRSIIDKNIDVFVIPLLPSPTHEIDHTLMEVRINRERVGIIDSKTLVDFISEIENCATQLKIEIHGILGIDLNAICDLIDSFREVTQFTIHDFTLLCANPSLTWNQLEWCDAPNAESDRCSTCIFGEERMNSESNRHKLIQKIGDTQIGVNSPSTFAKNYIYSKTGIHSEVIPHGEIRFTGHRRRTKGALKIAFVGLPVVAKGWNDFLDFYLSNCHDERIEIIHIGSIQSQVSFIPFIEYSDSKSNDLSSFLLSQLVDFVFLFPRGSETFSFVTYESIAAGCYLLSDCVSTQITQIGSDYSRIISFSGIEDLVQLGIDGKTFEFLSAFDPQTEYGQFLSREKLVVKNES
jgi:hypothetical protein